MEFDNMLSNKIVSDICICLIHYLS